MIIEIKEHLLAIHIGGLNYFRKQSCLKAGEIENKYSEKKHFEQLQTLSDTLFSVYEINIDRAINIIQTNQNLDVEALKNKILENQNIYISPFLPKVLAWRMLISFDQFESLHRMDNLLYLTHDTLVSDQAFCAVIEMLGALAKRNYYKYFEMLNNDKRLDYLSANASLVRLAKVRLNYILQEQPTLDSTLRSLNFNLDSQYDRDSVDHFLNKLGTSLKEVEDKKGKIDHSKADSISLRQDYWPNFYEKIEWRKPNTFKQTVNFDQIQSIKLKIRTIFQDVEDNKFPELLVENLIRKERKMSVIPPVKQIVPEIAQQKIVIKPKLELPPRKIKQGPTKENKPDENFEIIIPLGDQIKIEEEKKRKRTIERWQFLIEGAFEHEKKTVISQINDAFHQFREQDFYESYVQLKYFLQWKQNFKQIKYERQTANYINKYRNQQKIYHGINNEKIILKNNYVLNKPVSMEIEPVQQNKEKVTVNDKKQFYSDFLKVFDQKQHLIAPLDNNFFDMISINFLKEKNKMFTHVYYKITIVSDEQNPLIVKMVNNFSNYLSQHKNTQDQSVYNITIQIEDITIEYTLQLQMAKYLSSIKSQELSGTDLFIYIFTEQDDRKNQEYYECFKDHLKNLTSDKLSLGFNLLFLSVNEINKGVNQSKSKVSQDSNLIQTESNKKSSKGSVSKNDMLNSWMNKSLNQNSNTYQMMLELDYTNPEVQDSEGYVRRAIKYLNSRFDLKKDVEDNQIYQYYNVVSYVYENFNGKTINDNPFSERIFKASIDSAIEKSIHVKSPFGKIAQTTLSIELQKIRSILIFGNKQYSGSSGYPIPNKIAGLPPLPGTAGGHVLYKQLRELLVKENIIDTKKFNDMKNYFYFKYLLNNTLFQLFENFLGIMEQSHLIPFDQLTEFEQNHLILLEQTLSIIKEQLDRIFLRNSNKYLRQYIRKNYFTSFSYENVFKTIENYYKNLLEIPYSQNYTEFEDQLTQDSISTNIEAFQNMSKEMIEVIKNNFTFEYKPHQGIIGNWQAIFIKFLDQLIQIFQDNDIPMFLSQNFQFKFDCKDIKKNVNIEYNKMNEWLKDLKKSNDEYLDKKTETIEEETNQKQSSLHKKRQTDSMLSSKLSNLSNQSVIDLYSDILQYNTDYLLSKETYRDYQQVEKSRNKNNSLSNQKKQQQKGNPVLNEKQNSLSYSQSEASSAEGEDDMFSISSDSQSDDQKMKKQKNNQVNETDMYEEQNAIQQNQRRISKRRTACLVSNSKDEIQTNIEYNEKIQRLMRGEIVSSPIELDNSFV